MNKSLKLVAIPVAALILIAVAFHFASDGNETSTAAFHPHRKPTEQSTGGQNDTSNPSIVPAHKLYAGILEKAWYRVPRARVTHFNSQFGFVILDAGTNKDIQPGSKWLLHNAGEAIATVTVDKVEENESVANFYPVAKAEQIPDGRVVGAAVSAIDQGSLPDVPDHFAMSPDLLETEPENPSLNISAFRTN